MAGSKGIAALAAGATAAFLASMGCAPSHAGRTVGEGVLQAEGSLGGPLVTNLGTAFPVPNIPMGARYGLTDRIDVASHVNLLPLIMGGFLAWDASLTWGVVRHDGPEGWNLATGTGLVLFTDFQDGARVSPLIDLAGGYTFEWFTPFAGLEMAIDLWGGDTVIDPYLGFEIDIGDLVLSFAAIWFHAGYDWYASPVRYVSGDTNGALGFLLGLKYRWDLSEEVRRD